MVVILVSWAWRLLMRLAYSTLYVGRRKFLARGVAGSGWRADVVDKFSIFHPVLARI